MYMVHFYGLTAHMIHHTSRGSNDDLDTTL